MRKAGIAAALSLVALAAAPGGSSAHQTAYSNGVAVRIHVAPDDAPIAGQRSTIKVVSVRQSGWTFHGCGCRLRITDSSGHVVKRKRMRRRKAHFTFPRAGAYSVRIRGRVKRNGNRKRFSATFGYRAY